MRFLNKKGISPLIATVLLIGFTVALAAVVITWGSGFVQRVTTGTDERSTKAITCTSDLNFEIKAVKCPNKVTIENKGEIDISSFIVRFFNGNDISGDPQNLGALNKNEIKEFNLNLGMGPGTNKIDTIATVKIEGQDVVCSGAARTKTFSPC